MRPLNPVESIQPAWDHTRNLLIAPRRWKTFFKIAAVAVFAQMGGCNSSFNNFNRHHAALPPALHAMVLAIGLFVAIFVVILSLCFFYLGSRLQFVLFEVVLRRDTLVAPIWQRYGAATWRWIGLKLAYFAVAILCFLPILVPMFLRFYRGMRAEQAALAANPHHFAAFFLSMLGMMAGLVLVFLVIGQGYILLRDFGLPSMALEGTSFDLTLRRIWALIRTEPLQVLGYLVMYFLLSLAGAICSYIFIGILALVAMIPFGAIGVTLWLTLRHAATGGHIIMYGGFGFLGAIYILLLIFAFFMAMGYLLVFMQAYALYFLGGRYPLVGQYLDPLLNPAPPIYYEPQPTYPSAAYPPPSPTEPTPDVEPPFTPPSDVIDTTE